VNQEKNGEYMKMFKYLSFIVITLLLSDLIGCATPSSTNMSDPQINNEERIPVQNINEYNNNGEYVLHIGDIIDIKFFYNPELNETLTIRPDGMISLQMIDEVKAEGLTPSELDDILTKKYTDILGHSEVTVIVREFKGYNVFVGGEVNSPGLFMLGPKLTALQAIFQAGGVKNTADLKGVVILRNQNTSTPLFLRLDLDGDLKNAMTKQDIQLKPFDIVFVPKSTIARMDLFVEQYIDKLIPISRSLGIMYNLNPQVKVK
jgi:polysaccharide export outer membrane protein